MSPGIPTKIISACFALCAFIVAVIAGLAADNPADTILLRAIVGMFIAQIVGFLVGAAAERTITDSVRQYQANNPVPKLSTRQGNRPASTPDSDPTLTV